MACFGHRNRAVLWVFWNGIMLILFGIQITFQRGWVTEAGLCSWSSTDMTWWFIVMYNLIGCWSLFPTQLFDEKILPTKKLLTTYFWLWSLSQVWFCSGKCIILWGGYFCNWNVPTFSICPGHPPWINSWNLWWKRLWHSSIPL